MPKSGGPGKSTSTFNPNKKGLKNKNDKNKFGTSSSNGKGKGLNGMKPTVWPPTGDPGRGNPYCMNCTGTANLNVEKIEL